MADIPAKRGPLETAPVERATVRLSECPPRGRINLRGDAGDTRFMEAVTGVTGIKPPTAPNTAARAGETTVIWLGPDEWLIETGATEEAGIADALDGALAEMHAAVTVVGDASTTLLLEGRRAADVLAKGMTLDLHPGVFRPGHCARSLLAKIGVLLHRPGDQDGFEITVARSFSDYAWRWLEDATLEYSDADGGPAGAPAGS